MTPVEGHPTRPVTTLLIVGVFILIMAFLRHPAAAAQGRGGTLRIGMTAADIPYTAGQPDQGGEGYRFIGYPLYERMPPGSSSCMTSTHGR
jgi:hypothetical protein